MRSVVKHIQKRIHVLLVRVRVCLSRAIVMPDSASTHVCIAHWQSVPLYCSWLLLCIVIRIGNCMDLRVRADVDKHALLEAGAHGRTLRGAPLFSGAFRPARGSQ